MDFLQSWARGLVSASVLAALSQQLTGKSPQKKVVEFICGVVMLAILLSPVLRADRLAFSGALSRYHRTVAELTEDVEEQENQLLRTYIEQKSGAYILDEAEALGIEEMEVTVRTKWKEESWIPWEARLKGCFEAEQRARLAALIETELGIPGERQIWNE